MDVVTTASVVVPSRVVVGGAALVVVGAICKTTSVGATAVLVLPRLFALNAVFMFVVVMADFAVSALTGSLWILISVVTSAVPAAARRRLCWKSDVMTVLAVSTVARITVPGGVVHAVSYRTLGVSVVGVAAHPLIPATLATPSMYLRTLNVLAGGSVTATWNCTTYTSGRHWPPE